MKYAVNYRPYFETITKTAIFDTLNDAMEFKRVMKELDYVTFKPYEYIEV